MLKIILKIWLKPAFVFYKKLNYEIVRQDIFLILIAHFINFDFPFKNPKNADNIDSQQRNANVNTRQYFYIPVHMVT
jgi:hypothetical protein